MNFRVSSPATAFLFGEYGTRYGSGGITTAINLRTVTEVALRKDKKIVVTTAFGRYEGEVKGKDVVVSEALPSEVELSLFTIEDFYRSFALRQGIDVKIKSDIPPGSGIGSSAAMISSLYGALLLAAGEKLDRGEIMRLSKPLQAIAHGGSTSGTELMASVMGGLVEVDWDVPHPSSVRFEKKLVVGYTKVPRKTAEIVSVIEQKAELDPFGFDDLMFEIKQVVEKGKVAVADGDEKRLGVLFNENHSLLKELGISSIQLEKLVGAAKAAGALGAKISGPGGGKCMIALAPGKEKEVAAAIEAAGGKAYIVNTCAEGVKTEK